MSTGLVRSIGILSLLVGTCILVIQTRTWLYILQRGLMILVGVFTVMTGLLFLVSGKWEAIALIAFLLVFSLLIAVTETISAYRDYRYVLKSVEKLELARLRGIPDEIALYTETYGKTVKEIHRISFMRELKEADTSDWLQ